jgi:type I restriction enzyme S subunit
LGNALKVRKEKVDRTKVKFSDLQPITIHFDGSVDRRKVDENREYSMELFAVKPGDIIVSKIDLKNGAVGIVPEGWDNVVVTGHFAVYEPERSKLMPEYLHLLIQAKFFKSHLWRNKVGAEGRKEVKLDFFEAELIPFPPFSVQQKIVAAWEAAKKAAAETAAKVEQLERGIETRFLADLGIEDQPFFRGNRCFVSPWRLFERWGVEFNRWKWTLSDLLKGNYPLRPLHELAWMNPIHNPKLERSAKVSFVPMEAVDAEAGEITGATQREVSEVERGFTVFQEGDVIWAKITPCMQNGKCAVAKSLFNGVGYGSMEFHVIRSMDSKKLIPEFLWALLRLHRLREAAQRYFIGSAGQQRVPSEFLRELPIPIVPVNLQRQIVERVVRKRTEIAKLKAEAKALAEAAKAEVEAMILGVRKVGTT